MIERLLQAIETKGIKKHGRVSRIAEATKYSKGMVSIVLSGGEPLNDKFLRSVCRNFAINEEWVKTGKGDMLLDEKALDEYAMKTYMDYAMEVLLKRMPPESRKKLDEGKNIDKISVGSLSDKLSISPTEAITRLKQIGVGVDRSSRTVPVISKAQAGDFGFWEDQGDGSERIDCPADITDPHAFAFQVEGDSMYPRYKSGEYVIVDTTKPVMNNDDVVVKLHDGAVMVKLFKQVSGMVFLESYNQAVETIPVLDGEMVKCFKIVCRK